MIASPSPASSNQTKQILVQAATAVKDVAKHVLYGALMAGAFGAAAIGVIQMHDANATYNTVVKPTINNACTPPGAYMVDYRTQGLSGDLVAGMLLTHPEHTRQICATVNAALKNDTMPNNFMLDNTSVHALANVLGVDAKVANAAIQEADFQKLLQEKKEAVAHTYANPVSMSGPGL